MGYFRSSHPAKRQPVYGLYTTAAFQPTFNANNQVNGFKTGSGDYNADGYNYDFPNAPTNGYQHTTSRQAYISTGVLSASQFPDSCTGDEWK